MSGVHALDDIPCKETNATAADNDAFGKYICLEGSRCLTVIDAEKYGTTPLSVKTTRHEVSILRWQKLNAAEGRLIASVCGQYVDIHSVSVESISTVSTVRVHPLNVTDIDWCAHDANSFVTSSIDDAINVWDVRDLRRPSAQLHVVAGAEQAKWAPHAQHYLCTSHGTDIRLWDIRSVASPLQSIPAHLQKMCCVVWHPTDPLCFVTTSLDGYIKMWNFADLTKPRYSIGMLPAPVWKLKFSFDGEEFASIRLPQNGVQTSKNTLNVWRSGELDNAQAMKCDDDVILDVCWQKSQSRRRSFKYLYSVSRSGKLRRYPLSPYEVACNSTVDITTPIPVDSTEWDGERAQATSFHIDVDVADDRTPHRSMPANVARSVCPYLGKDMTRFAVHRVNEGNVEQKLDARTNSHRVMELRRSDAEAPLPGFSSPIPPAAEWRVWIKASRVEGGLRSELDALRHLGTQGLFTDEVDLLHATVALSYVHYASNKKVKFMIRFRPAYANGQVCIEIVEEDSPLNKEQAAQLLELLFKEATASADTCTTTALASALKKLPEIIDSIKVFSPKSIDIPRAGNAFDLRGGCASAEAGRVAPRSVDSETPKASSLKPGYLSPSQFRSMFDKWVPSPRTCGARFNGSGFLVVFGPVKFCHRKEVPKTKEKSARDELKSIPSENILLDMKRNKSIGRTSQHSVSDVKDKDVVHGTPRSLDDYNQWLLAAFAQNATRSSQHATPSEHSAHSPSSTVAFYSQFANTTGLVGGNPPGGVIPPLLQTASSVSKASAHKLGRTSASSAASGTSRSFSMQDVPLSLVAASRNRGNSLTGVLADDHYQPAEGAPYSTATIYDASGLMTVSKALARKYRLVGKSALELCLWNMKVADEEDRKDLVKIWQIVELCIRAGRPSWRRQYSALCSKKQSQQPTGVVAQSEESCESSDEDDNECSWAAHPFGRDLINSLLDYFGRINDYQTAAMIICVLSPRIKRDFKVLQAEQDKLLDQVQRRPVYHGRSNSTAENTSNEMALLRCNRQRLNWLLGGFAGHNTISVTPTRENYRKVEESFKSVLEATEKEKRSLTMSAECERVTEAHSPPGRIASFFSSARPRLPRRFHFTSETIESVATHAGSNSTRMCGESTPAHRHSDVFEAQRNVSSNEHGNDPKKEKHINSLLDPVLSRRLDDVRQQYGDMLFRWRMYSKCAEVMKYSQNAPIALPLWIRCKCGKCGNRCERGFCDPCNSRPPPLLCALCQMPVRGLVTACALCHHGGHSEHILEWFQQNNNCPCGCGCECKASGF
uniref:WD repeat-containing protein 59 n=1 Tax=Ascaris suum TaxID=6253 RepID=F1KQX5_ASCSU